MTRFDPDKNEGLGVPVDRTFSGLAKQFVFPPFSVMRANDGKWAQRKRLWLSLGIKSEVGRGAAAFQQTSELEVAMKRREGRNAPPSKKHNYGKDFAIGSKTAWEEEKKSGLLHKGPTVNTKEGDQWDGGRSARQNEGTSIFDPVLCELAYSWFCPEGGQIIDPFAGGSVRGVVAHMLGYRYWGSELRPEQVAANIEQGKEITPNNPPQWVCGDSRHELKAAPAADFVFSCPPYGNLEVYSELDADISNKEYPDFIESYNVIVKKACRKLKQDRFACFVVGNFRDAQGFYYDFVGDTVRAFEAAGARYYNEAVLVTAIGSLPVRIGRQFQAGRKLGKTHQNILVFYKGDPRKIKDNFGKLERS